MSYITHPLIKPESIDSREYQLSIAMRALDANTMVILPTGLGKQQLHFSSLHPGFIMKGAGCSCSLRQNPSWNNTSVFFERYLLVKRKEGMDVSPFVMFTGEAPPDQRTTEWNNATVILATPQVVKNDLIAGRYTLKDVSLLIVDECHRAVGNYAYVFLAQRYLATADKPLLLAMTASPGGILEKVEEVSSNLGIMHVENRTEHDPMSGRMYSNGRLILSVSIFLRNSKVRSGSSIPVLMNVLPCLRLFTLLCQNVRN